MTIRVGKAFSLIELIVVIGLIAIFVALLLPALSQARRSEQAVRCRANLREVGQALRVYASDNDGWPYPVGRTPAGAFRVDAFGLPVPPHERWPMKVFKVPAAPLPPPYDPAAYSMQPYDPSYFPAEPYTPAILRCPGDPEPAEAHTYCLNGHIAQRRVRTGTSAISPSAGGGPVSSSTIILAGEKLSHERDYFMQGADFDRLIDPARHGRRLRSNYLYLDGHADNMPPRQARAALDPWDLPSAR